MSEASTEMASHAEAGTDALEAEETKEAEPQALPNLGKRIFFAYNLCCSIMMILWLSV